MIETVEYNSLKKLVGEEKKCYLANLNAAISRTSEDFTCFHVIPSLVCVLAESGYAEVDLANGLPSITSILSIASMSKDIKKEFQDIKSKISLDNKTDEGKSLEQMIVEKVKAKIYFFDTLTAEELTKEGTPFYDLLSTEFTLRDKLYLLKAVEAHPLSLDTDLKVGYDNGHTRYTGVFQLTGFDSRENKFISYKINTNFYYKKKIFDLESQGERLKPKHEEILKKQFSTGNLDLMYKALTDIKHLWVAKITRSTLGPFCDKNTGEVPGVLLPEDFFKDHPNSYVLNVFTETIDTSTEVPERFKRTNTTQAKKNNMKYRTVHQDVFKKMKDFYKDDENIKVVT